jgi:hypothetical protein
MWKSLIIDLIKISSITLLILLTAPVRSQEMLGLVNGNYAGVNSAIINPSLLLNSRLYMDINVVAADVFHQNNYLYISKDEYNFFDFFKKDYTIELHPVEHSNGDRPFYTNNNKSNKQFYTNVIVQGPSAMLVANDHAFAIQTSFYTVNVIKDLPYDMANFFYYDLSYAQQRNILFTHDDEYNFSTLTWSEISFSYAYVLKKYSRNRWTVGITLKKLLGHAGTYFNSYKTDYYVPNGSTVDILDITADVGYALPIDYSTNDGFYGSFIKGYGVGFDLGMTYQKNKKGHSNIKYRKLCNQKFDQYNYRIGFSILDFGMIKFRNNARKYEFHHGSVYWEDIDSIFKAYKNINQLSEDFSTRLCGSPTCTQTADEFSIALPAAVSMQFDYSYNDHWYLNATVVHPVRIAKAYIYRPAVIGLTPRYESRFFDISLPISLYDYRYPRIGLAARIYYFTIGTEKILGFFNLTNFSGLDLYVALKFYLEKGSCKSKQPRFCYERPCIKRKDRYRDSPRPPK